MKETTSAIRDLCLTREKNYYFVTTSEKPKVIMNK